MRNGTIVFHFNYTWTHNQQDAIEFTSTGLKFANNEKGIPMKSSLMMIMLPLVMSVATANINSSNNAYAQPDYIELIPKYLLQFNQIGHLKV
jgi:hypothetical protein